MRSLFLRIFVFFWAALTVTGAASTAIHAAVRPEPLSRRRARFMSEALRAHGELAAQDLENGGPPEAARTLRSLSSATGIRVFLVDGPSGRVIAASAAGAPRVVLDVARRAHGTRALFVRANGSDEHVAVPLRRAAAGTVVVGVLERPSRWLLFVSPSTLPYRVLVLFLVSGILSFALARYLTKPLRHLREAARRVADGDLSVRVAPAVGRSGGEVAGLGQDFDRMAERVEGLLESQRQLLRDVSHELRSPLARLGVALELARARAGEDAKAPLDRIERETERLGDLIGQILLVTRLETSNGVRSEPVDLEELVGKIVQDADYEARARGRRVELARAEPLVVMGTEELLWRAIENVVRNAAAFTEEGTAVEVRLEPGPTAATARLMVRDHGRGVPDEALRDIFRPFYRVGDARDRKTGGTGLGLAIADRAVRLHGGTVAAQNTGDGLLVTIELPVASAPAT